MPSTPVKKSDPMNLGLYFLALFFLSQSGHWARWSETPPEVLGFWRLLIATILIFTYRLILRLLKTQKLSPPFFAQDKRALLFSVLAGVLFFFHLWAFKYQAQHTRIANGMILFAANPLFTALATMTFFRERLSTRLILAYFLAICGIYILVSHQLDFEPATLAGDIAAILAALLYSGYILISKLGRKDLEQTNFMLILFGTASLCFLLLALTKGTPIWPTESRTWVAATGLALFSTLLGHGLFAYLLNYMNVNIMSCGKLIEPVLAAVTAWFFFSENINSSMLLSFLLTAASVLVLFSNRLPLLNRRRKL